MKDLVNMLTAWQLLQIFFWLIIFLNALLARRSAIAENPNKGWANWIIPFLLFCLLGLPVVIYNAIRVKDGKQNRS